MMLGRPPFSVIICTPFKLGQFFFHGKGLPFAQSKCDRDELKEGDKTVELLLHRQNCWYTEKIDFIKEKR